MSKLLKKDVLKWIRNLSSGRYKKGKSRLVSSDGTKFCCLGVWADQHGATWAEELGDALVPVGKGRRNSVNRVEGIRNSSSYLFDPRLSKGLEHSTQKNLASLNDGSTTGFRPVIRYIKKEILPFAK